jgi:2-oxo-4-hydroxy-4-carboxy-5-ureidoimidazoline decarboxylase
MNGVLARWNGLSLHQATEEILPCCGSQSWARQMAMRRPIGDEGALQAACDEVCKGLTDSDWDEAFSSHPRIGESHSEVRSTATAAAWSGREQRKVGGASEDVKAALADGNRAYEQRFHRIFIVCAAGKSGPEILEILRSRLGNDERSELLEAAEQQRQIAQLRLKKWLAT